MVDRSWFFASEGAQQGPYPETQFRQFFANRTLTAETLVWTEGMANWQTARDIPGLLSGAAGPVIPGSAGLPAGAGGHGGGTLSIDLPLWPLLGRSLLFVIGFLLIIPAPWTTTNYYRWTASRIDVPGRPNFAFTGQVGDIWYVFVAMGLMAWLGSIDLNYLQHLAIPIQAVLSWMAMRWVAAHLSSNGQPLPTAFEGSALGYVGWTLLMYVSVVTIVGWAWVVTAWMRWMCRNVSGTHREIIFNGTGLEVLWRTILFVLGCALLIPIPWVLRWYTAWYVSQFALVERTA